eukprot:2131004-Amphidinium_carterae.1
MDVIESERREVSGRAKTRSSSSKICCVPFGYSLFSVRAHVLCSLVQDKAINGLREKSAHLWHVYKIGYAAITVTPEDMTVRFFTVQDGKAVEEPQGRYVKRRRPQNNAGKAA